LVVVSVLKDAEVTGTLVAEVFQAMSLLV